MLHVRRPLLKAATEEVVKLARTSAVESTLSPSFTQHCNKWTLSSPLTLSSHLGKVISILRIAKLITQPPNPLSPTKVFILALK